ncbi:MAG: class I SAM-dependent methyltransferase [Deltaproteobacteria bacterium]|nr:class I SAM-dependent methyltransferase [Deltaproteobacteria bacterium]
MGHRLVTKFDALVKTERTDELYPLHYMDIEEQAFPLFRMDERIVSELVAPGCRVLDAMCGTGRHLALLAAKGATVTGNDYNPHMLERAGALLRERGLTAELTQSDVVEGMPFPEGRFDWVLSMFHSLGSVPSQENRQRAVDEMARVLRPGGSLLLHGHNLLSNLNREKFLDWTIPHLIHPPPDHEMGDIALNGYGNEKHKRKPSFIHVHMPWELLGYLPRSRLRIEKVFFLDHARECYTEVHYDPSSTASMTQIGHGFYQADGIIVQGRKPREEMSE